MKSRWANIKWELRIDAADIYIKMPLSLESLEIARRALNIASEQIKKTEGGK